MALRNAVLAALLDGEASGYELSKAFASSVANFWTVTPQQLYRELEKLEGEGLIAGRVVEQVRRPNKRVFSLTQTGREALAAFTALPPRPGAVRDELLVKVQAVDVGDVDAVRAAIGERMKQSHLKLAEYRRIREKLLAGRDEAEYLRTARRIGPYLTLLRGLSYEEENLRWGERALELLEARASATEPDKG
ncbi:PadR family transcriptional regulator [Streptomyces sp. NPDC086549]|uniref:PadR family transcriptional regulator n=1 Tax=Streptomyces sp. NPDC086549 TaxID=3365752 RepID=UPI00381F3393